MLNDLDLEKLNNDLTAITQTSKTYQNNLQIVLERFQDLLERYNSLKSDYEEEKTGRERYKRQAKARSLIQDRNPFVLVLIDGNDYMFKTELIKAGAEGGVRAAQLLNDSIKAEIPPDVPDNCRIVVRIYADVFDLSATLGRANLVGREARSFSKFTSSFTHAQDLSDFVDVDTKKEGVKSKIREMFRLFVDSNQCKHLFFGGCHDAEYISMLTPYRNEIDRITLVKAANINAEYLGLGLTVKEFPSVFMSTSIEDTASAASPVGPDKPVCTHFLKGICRYGASCTKSHVSERFKINVSQDPFKPRSKSLSNSLSILSRKQNYAKLLPKASGNTTCRIPVDKDGGRIDTYTPQPSDESFHRYKDLSPRPCNKYHLVDSCSDANCSFDHGHVEPEFVGIMRYQAKRRQCHQGRDCRVLKCIYGHHCQIDGCTGGGSCKMSPPFHRFDPRVARWVEPDEPAKDTEEDRFQSMWNSAGGSGSLQTDAKDTEIEEFEAMWNGTGDAQTDNQIESSQAFPMTNATNEGTDADLLDAAESASNFSIEW